MVLVPQDFVSQHGHQRVQTNPLVRNLSQLDLEMKRILSLEDIGDDEKIKLYNQVLQKYLEFDEQRKERHPLPVRIIPSTKTEAMSEESKDQYPSQREMDIESEIIDSVPKGFKNKARLLVNKLRQNKNIVYWNDMGELLYDGKPVSGTSIVDLVRDAMGERKRFQPQHWDLFSRGLARINTPLDWIGNDNRKRSLLEYKGFGKDENDEDFEMSHGEKVSTPTSLTKTKKSKRVKPAWIQY